MKYKHLSYSDRQEMEKIEYQYGNMKSTVPKKIARKKIKRVHSNGGWSLMDYWIET